jgi:protein SCO1/2
MKRVKWLLWTALIVAGVAAFAANQLNAGRRTEKGEFGRVPAFSLTDQRGRVVTDADLRGSVWVANFVFTRCPSVCPLLTAKFKALQERIGPIAGVKYISLSVDPAHDTPAVLADYAAKYDADPERWRFLTGPLETIEKTVVSGFKIHIGEPKPSANDPSLVEIMHGEHLVLVDATGMIRGYYRAEQPELDELARDLRALAESAEVAQLAK